MKIPADQLSIDSTQSLGKTLFLATLAFWPASSQYPTGQLVRTLGSVGELDVQTEALLASAGVRAGPFSEAVHACLPKMVCVENWGNWMDGGDQWDW